MKALTLTQPWATLVAIGAKRYETRSWSTPHRGKLAIHAAKGWRPEDRDLLFVQPFRRVLETAGVDWPHQLPRGAVIAIAELVEIVPADRAVIDADEHAFGDFSPGRFAWRLDRVEALREPVAVRGSLGLWEWEP